MRRHSFKVHSVVDLGLGSNHLVEGKVIVTLLQGVKGDVLVEVAQ